MKRGKGRSSWQAHPSKCGLRLAGYCAVLVLVLLAGCSTTSPAVERNLMADRGQTNRNEGVAERYTVLCPDVLAIDLVGHPELSGPHPVGVDGCLDLEPLGRPCVEGQTVDEIAQEIADLAVVPVEHVRIRVADYRSQCVFLFGEVMGAERAVPYQGQETVLDLLQRIGGITPGAAPDDVYVVRPHVQDRQRPEVFHVDLPAIVLRHDERTNLRLLPFDQIHVGQTYRAKLTSCVPPWLRPVYESLCSWLPFPQATPSGPRSAAE
jgi:protein involved in polysaccharide export with SLBB domain